MGLYTELYKKGIKHLDDDLQDIINHLDSGESICLCSPNMGDTRLIDYLAFTLSRSAKYHLIYDVNGELDEDELQFKIDSQKTTPTLILIPRYMNKKKKFRDYFKKTVTYKTNLQSVVSLEYDFLKRPDMYFDSGKAMSYTKIRNPFNLEMTKSVIESRRFLNNWIVPVGVEKEIYALSGGVTGLIKHICSYVDKYGKVNVDELICYPPVVRTLADLKLAFDILDDVHLHQLGYINKKGIVNGVLLSRYLQTGSKLNSFNISVPMQELLDFLLSRKGELVTVVEIDEHINAEGDFSMWGTYKLISRLRSAIKEKYDIQNVKGKGYILKDKAYV
ncbi:MAG: helix-turn-helix domain-containing protein [Patescibacteria group bacterium]|nr:helix-turn-helix domain-containing protein [Patescibacteria group bacterium]